MRRLLLRQWFLVALAAILVGGFGFSRALEPLARAVPRGALVAGVLFLMAISLDASAIWRALRRPGAVLLAVLVNFVLLPLGAWLISPWLHGELAIGLLVVGSVPSTLTAAAVWTRRAGGNDAVALLVTLITNLLCFVVTPLWLLFTTGYRASLPAGELILRLGLLVLVPTLAGQGLRLFQPVARFATRHIIAVGMLAQLGILTMVMVGSVFAARQLAATRDALGIASWLGMLACVAGLHVAGLAAAHLSAAGLGIARADRIAVGFSGSQKTLMLGLHIALEFSGLAMLPMVAYHVCQLLIDTVVADRLVGTGAKRSTADSAGRPGRPDG